MSVLDLLASDVMNAVGPLLNDSALSRYTQTVQLPYLNIAVQELREILEDSDVDVVQKMSAIMTIAAATSPGIVSLTYSDSAGPPTNLPPDLIAIEGAWESISGEDNFVPMTKVEFLPHYLEGVLTDQFVFWAWQNNSMQFIGSDQANDIKVDYLAEILSGTTIVANTNFQIPNCRSFLTYRTAGLCARFVMENPTRADQLDAMFTAAQDRMINISVKGKQNIFTRRRPFRAGWKTRSIG